MLAIAVEKAGLVNHVYRVGLGKCLNLFVRKCGVGKYPLWPGCHAVSNIRVNSDKKKKCKQGIYLMKI